MTMTTTHRRPAARLLATLPAVFVVGVLAGAAYAQPARPTQAPFGVKVQGARALTAAEKQQFQASLAADRAAVSRLMTPQMRSSLESDGAGLERNMGRAIKQMTLGAPSPIGEPASGAVVIPKARYVSRYLRQGPVPGSFGSEWVSWAMRPADLARDLPRPKNDAWQAEDLIPNGWPAVNRQQWKGLFWEVATSQPDGDGLSGGHMCDSGGSCFSRSDQLSTYRYMSNAFPQWYDNNAGAWHTLERDLRDLVRRGYHIYNYAGPVWTPFTYARLNGQSTTVQTRVMRQGIPVPTAFWKISVAVPPDTDVGNAIAEARVFGVVVPNTKDAGLLASPWMRFTKTGAEIEQLTGLRLFTRLPEDVRQALLNHRDQRQGFDFGIEIPGYKEQALRNLARLGGTPEDVAAAQQLLRDGRLTGGEIKQTTGSPTELNRLRQERAPSAEQQPAGESP